MRRSPRYATIQSKMSGGRGLVKWKALGRPGTTRDNQGQPGTTWDDQRAQAVTPKNQILVPIRKKKGSIPVIDIIRQD